MFKNYFKTAFRSIRRNTIFSLINIIGLAIGISASLVIYLIVSYDFSFDTFQKNRDRIYRVVSIMHFPDEEFKNSGMPLPLSQAVAQQVPGIVIATPFETAERSLKVRIQTTSNSKPTIYIYQPNIIFADSNYFKLIQYQWIAGSVTTALQTPFSVVLTESRAKLYFSGQDATKAVGQTITYNDSIEATVTGIVKDLAQTTDFTFKEFISYSTLRKSNIKEYMAWDQWGNINSSSQFFVQLQPGITPTQVETQINKLQDAHQTGDGLKTTHLLQPLADIHFNPDYDNFDQRKAHLPTLYGLLGVAAILLLLGCINFINLTTAHAAQRAKEIGIRKTMGSSKKQLTFQFLSETFLLTLVALLVSLLFIPFLLKVFADFIPPELTIRSIGQPHVVIFLVVLLITVTFFSGFYPALVLSAYKPIAVLKNQSNQTATGRRIWLRKSLTLTQFIIAQALVMATIIVGKQIHYSLNKELGFRKNGIVTVNTPWQIEDNSKKEVLLQKIQAIPGVATAVLAGPTPSYIGTASTTMKFYDGKKETETTVETKYADSAYFRLYQMKLLAGRYLRPSTADTVAEYLINETYARVLGFQNPADAVGAMLGGAEKKIPIVGVLRDFYPHSLHEPIKPLAYSSNARGYGSIHILLRDNTDGTIWKSALASVQKAYEQVYPEQEYTYEFFDESIAKYYTSEQHVSSLLRWATGLTVFISCLGLLGLVIYTTHQRTKEIGVRKVLGASISQIVTILSKDFIGLILLAFAIAVPLAWLAMHKWLENFVDRTTISWWVFVLSGIITILVAFLTLSFHTIKAAIANPVKSLRTE